MTTTKKTDADKAANDNRSRQLNENNDAYWKSRGQARPAPTKSREDAGSRK